MFKPRCRDHGVHSLPYLKDVGMLVLKYLYVDTMYLLLLHLHCFVYMYIMCTEWAGKEIVNGSEI